MRDPSFAGAGRGIEVFFEFGAVACEYAAESFARLAGFELCVDEELVESFVWFAAPR